MPSLSCLLALPGATGFGEWLPVGALMGDWKAERKGEPGCSPSPPPSVLGYVFGSGCVSSDHHGPALPGRGSNHTPSSCIPLGPVGGPGSLLLSLSSEGFLGSASKLFHPCEHFPALHSLPVYCLMWLFP